MDTAGDFKNLNTKALALEEQEYMRSVRRYLHENPELSGQESNTSAFICSELDKIGVPYSKLGDNGIVATIEGKSLDRMVALRADFDALPIIEDNDHLSYRSKVHGVMHACGHDGHAAMLLGAARILMQLRHEMNGTVKLCFQPAEEILKGTEEIIAELKKHPVETVFGLHLLSDIESGKISIESGSRMAAGQGVKIEVRGIGTHGAYPNKGVDPIIAAAAIVMNCSALISREIDPAEPVALTFGTINGGVARNAIPDNVTITGTVRTTTSNTFQYVRDALPRIAKNTAEAFKATAEVEFLTGCGPVDNDERCSKIAETAVKQLGMESALISHATSMASENYADFLAVYPGIFGFVGIADKEKGSFYPHHHPKFNIDEEQLWVGAALHAQYAIEFLRS